MRVAVADHASIAFEDLESGSPAAPAPVLWAAEAKCRRARLGVTEPYGHTTQHSVSVRSSGSIPDVEGPREGSAPQSRGDSPSDCDLPSTRQPSQSEDQHPLPGQDPAGGHVRRSNRPAPSWHLAPEALLTVVRGWGTGTIGGKRGFHREAGRARELGGRAWRPGEAIFTDEPSALLEDAHETDSSNQRRAPWEHPDPGLTLLGWLPTYFDVSVTPTLPHSDSDAYALTDRRRQSPTRGRHGAVRFFLLNPQPRRFRLAEIASRKDGTTAEERTMTMASAEAARRLGPLIRNQPTNMGLDNFPEKCGCAKHSYPSNVPDCGATHGPDEPCPFEKDDFPIGMMGTCCSLRGKAAARELEALGEHRLAEAMYRDMTCAKVEIFAKKLREAADRLERRHAGQSAKPTGAGWNGLWVAKKKEWEWQNHSTFEEALAAIREAARWYEKVASLGFGVHAWY